jgi:hypothetical protein
MPFPISAAGRTIEAQGSGLTRRTREARLQQRAVDPVCESAYARGSFDMLEPSSAGIAIARADRTFCRL